MTTGVLLAQLGTPDAPTTPAVRRYLREFLRDRRIVDLPRVLWIPILEGIILRTRPRRSAANYARIWTDEGSPLLVHTASLATKLDAALGEDVRVTYGMRIGRPSLAAALDDLVGRGVDELLVVPCYPQFARATTASVQDAVGWWQEERSGPPTAQVLGSFPDHPGYVAALAATVREAGVRPTPRAPLVMSFHGIPQRQADRGDPYPAECEATARALAKALDLEGDAWHLTYQSRFGPAAWLRPYTDETLERLAGEGIRDVAVVSPSFLADCLETIDEIGRELRETFEAAGGTSFTRVPCLNDRDDLVAVLADLVGAARPVSGS